MDDDLFAHYEDREENTLAIAEEIMEVEHDLTLEEENVDPARVLG
jgi:hypothetical protein